MWLVTGLLHGSGLTYIVSAILHFIVQLAEKYLPLNKIPTLLSRIYTIIIVIVAWCIFGADSMTAAANYLSAMFGIKCSGIFDAACVELIKGYWCPLLAGCIFSLPLYPWLCKKAEGRRALSILIDVAVVLIFIVAIIFQAGVGASAPMYAGF